MVPVCCGTAVNTVCVSLMFGRCAFVILCCVHKRKWECFDDNFGWDWLAYCYEEIEMYYWLMSLKFMIEKKKYAADCRLSCLGPAVTSKQPQLTGQRPLVSRVLTRRGSSVSLSVYEVRAQPCRDGWSPLQSNMIFSKTTGNICKIK